MKKVDTPSGTKEGNVLPLSISSVNLAESRNRYGRIIHDYRIKSGMEVSTLSKRMGFSKSAITNWEAGIRRPEVGAIGKLCRILNIPPAVFFDLPHEETLTKDERTLMQDYRSLSKFNKKSALQIVRIMVDNELKALRENYKSSFVRIAEAQLPASAGTGMALDSIEAPEYLFVRASREAYMADEIIAVSGDSMEPTYKHGDMLFVEHTSEIEPGEIGIFVIAGDGFVKEYQRDGLHSHNAKYHTIRPSEDDGTRCIGRVIGIVGEDQLATPEEYNILSEIFSDEDNEE